MLKRVFALVMFAAFALMMTQGAFAQKEINYFTPTEVMKYNLYKYPSNDSYFYLPYRFKSEFCIANGKYFAIENDEFLGTRRLNMDVEFYYPGVNGGADKLIERVKVRSSRVTYSIPHKFNTIDGCDLKVRIINRDKNNKDLRFLVYVPVNAVAGVPTGKVNYGTYTPDCGPCTIKTANDPGYVAPSANCPVHPDNSCRK